MPLHACTQALENLNDNDDDCYRVCIYIYMVTPPPRAYLQEGVYHICICIFIFMIIYIYVYITITITITTTTTTTIIIIIIIITIIFFIIITIIFFIVLLRTFRKKLLGVTWDYVTQHPSAPPRRQRLPWRSRIRSSPTSSNSCTKRGKTWEVIQTLQYIYVYIIYIYMMCVLYLMLCTAHIRVCVYTHNMYVNLCILFYRYSIKSHTTSWLTIVSQLCWLSCSHPHPALQ